MMFILSGEMKCCKNIFYKMEKQINFHAYENENIEKLLLEFPQKKKKNI